jgi:hypothetical protein
MKDLAHYFGGDIAVSATGDLQTVDDTLKGQQRILRRLLTNPLRKDSSGNPISQADYIWHPNYGAGLPWYIGRTINIPEIRSLIRSQILLESCVAKSPEPIITLKEIPNGLSCRIQYNDAGTKTAQTLSFDVTR